MNVNKYSAYFHDGALLDVQQYEDEIVFSMESAEMDPSDMKDEIQLSERETIKGRLHVKGIKLIQINEIPFAGCLEKTYDSGKIFDLQITKDKVEIAVSWENFPPKPSVNDFSTISIEAHEISWENIPDLKDPFW